MPVLQGKRLKSVGISATIKAEVLTIKEHGGEDWQPGWGDASDKEEDQFYATLRKVSRRISPPDRAK